MRALQGRPSAWAHLPGLRAVLTIDRVIKMSELIEPPEPFTQPIIRCPSCNHGIDPHGLDPGGICGVGDEQGKPCLCRWQPNDIAAAQIKAAYHLAVFPPGSNEILPSQDEDDGHWYG